MKKLKIKIHARMEFEYELSEKEIEEFEDIPIEEKQINADLMKHAVKEFFRDNVDPETKVLKEFVNVSIFLEDE